MLIAGIRVVESELDRNLWAANRPRVALLQGNIPQEMKWRPERAMATLETYLQMAQVGAGND